MIYTEDFVFDTPFGEFVVQRPTDEPPAFVYLFHSPEINRYKIGRTKNARALQGRLKERIRQCGKTNILALWKVHPKDAPAKEKELLDKAKPYLLGREILKWDGDFIEFYAVFMQGADWTVYSMDIVWLPDGSVGMKNYQESTPVDEWLKSLEIKSFSFGL